MPDYQSHEYSEPPQAYRKLKFTPPISSCTFAALRSELQSDRLYICPCTNSQSTQLIPSFVGQDYFCETGIIVAIVKVYFTVMVTHSGMERTVAQEVLAASCTVHHTFAKVYLSLQLIILTSEYVVISCLVMRTLLLNLLRYLCSNYLSVVNI